jgi:hexosaminidase
LEQALATFTSATHAALAKVGKTPVVWEGQWIKHARSRTLLIRLDQPEMVLEHSLALSNETVVM